MTFPRSIVVATDGSASAQRALEIGVELARSSGGSLTIAMVVPEHAVYSGYAHQVREEVNPENRRWFTEVAARAYDFAHDAGVREVRIERREGAVVDQLLALLDELQPELLIMGSRGLSPTKRLFLGSVSEALIHRAKVSTLIARPAQPGGPAPS